MGPPEQPELLAPLVLRVLLAPTEQQEPLELQVLTVPLVPQVSPVLMEQLVQPVL